MISAGNSLTNIQYLELKLEYRICLCVSPDNVSPINKFEKYNGYKNKKWGMIPIFLCL